MVTVASTLEDKCMGSDLANGACDELSMLQMVRRVSSDSFDHLEDELARAWQIASADLDTNDQSKLSQAVGFLKTIGQELDHVWASNASVSLLQKGDVTSPWQWQAKQVEQFRTHATMDFLQRIQVISMQSPDLFSTLLYMFKFLEGILANDPVYLVEQRKRLGDIFVCAGQLVLADHRFVEAALTSPQARARQLGSVMLAKEKMPALDIGEREALLIVLSQKEAGGNGDWEAFRAAFEKYLFSNKTLARQQDAIAKAMLDELAEAYTTMPHTRGFRWMGGVFSTGENFFTDRPGLQGFLNRYLHYVLMGLDPHDNETMTKLYDLHYGTTAAVHYFDLPFPSDPSSPAIDEAQKIYEKAPFMDDFESTADINNMTRSEFARAAVALMSIAGLQGPLHAARTSLGYNPLPWYLDWDLLNLDLAEIWDKLDLTDRGALRSYFMECIRLNPPVSASHHVATKQVTVTMAGERYTFPKGTQMAIAMNIGSVDPDIWGSTAMKFEAARPGLEEKLMAFHSVGTQSAGRICPAREVTLNMMTDVLAVVGAARRAM